eukprot:3742423-Prorocentrum_lima.AAC.1
MLAADDALNRGPLKQTEVPADLPADYTADDAADFLAALKRLRDGRADKDSELIGKFRAVFCSTTKHPNIANLVRIADDNKQTWEVFYNGLDAHLSRSKEEADEQAFNDFEGYAVNKANLPGAARDFQVFVHKHKLLDTLKPIFLCNRFLKKCDLSSDVHLTIATELKKKSAVSFDEGMLYLISCFKSAQSKPAASAALPSLRK